MIKISFPGITQEQFKDAFNVLEECKAVPVLGFKYPFMGPGGQYGNCWWERDSSLTLNGYCWLDNDFAMRALWNFTLVQRENGRIPLWGHDTVGDFDIQLSAIPVIFDTAFKICRRTNDREYVLKIYEMLKKYFAWWMSPVKRDGRTGLVCGIFEETDPSDYKEQLTYAPVDLNVQVCNGAGVLAELAEHLDLPEDGLYFRNSFQTLRDAINRYLWDEEDGFYYTLNVKEDRLTKHRPYNSAFDTFKRGIVPENRRERLLEKLKDNSKYGYYNRFGITTAPFDSPEYCETTGDYKGWTSWSGNIWTLRNKIIAKGLKDCGLRNEAAHIAYQTVMTFNGNYAEFVSPSTGIGHGVKRYGWSASEYIELITELIFGIDYCAWDGSVTVNPCIPEELAGCTISLSGLRLGNGETLNVTVRCGEGAQPAEIVTVERKKNG